MSGEEATSHCAGSPDVNEPEREFAPEKGEGANVVGSDSSISQEAARDYDDYVPHDEPAKASLPLAAVVGICIVAVLAGLAGYLGFQAYQAHQESEQRALLVQVARQGAVNLTTIDWQHADADVQRILDSATGELYDDFSQRAQPFLDVVKRAQSTSVGTVTEAGMESYEGNNAQVLVAVSVETTIPGAPEQGPRNWRMRMSVEKLGDDAKVSNVEFVP